MQKKTSKTFIKVMSTFDYHRMFYRTVQQATTIHDSIFALLKLFIPKEPANFSAKSSKML